jgi:site-specific DNA-cytosine methylase
MNNRKIKALVFYATYGHWSQALLNAGIDLVRHYQPDVTIDADKRMEQDKLSSMVLNMNFPNIPIQVPSFGYNLPIELKTDIDIMVGSPPCVGFSKASPISRLDHPMNKHTLNFAKWADKLRPKHFLMEMVPELLTKGKELWLKYIQIINNEYQYTYQIMDAADYGAAQRRSRLLIWGCRRDQEWVEPLETLPLNHARSIADVVPEGVSKEYDNYKPDTKMLMSLYRVADGKFRKGPFSLLATREKRLKRSLTGEDISFTLVKFSTHNQIYLREKGERFFAIPELKLIMGFPMWYKFPPKNVQEVSRMIASGIDVRFATYLLEHIRMILEC